MIRSTMRGGSKDGFCKQFLKPWLAACFMHPFHDFSDINEPIYPYPKNEATLASRPSNGYVSIIAWRVSSRATDVIGFQWCIYNVITDKS